MDLVAGSSGMKMCVGGSTDSGAEVHLHLIGQLRSAGLLKSDAVRLTALPGGVSSEIFLVESESGRFVVKQALARLKVRDEWVADVGRNAIEQAFIRLVARIEPAAVPRLLAADAKAGWFAMEYLGPQFINWKTRLLAGHADPGTAYRAGVVLGGIHRETWSDSATAEKFATWPNFYQLRAEPYFETSARRVPDLAPQLLAEVRRLQTAAIALIHGDFSPKNMLVSADRFVVVDAEVACFGDPAFDAAFLLTHLLLKASLHPARAEEFLELGKVFWAAYGRVLKQFMTPELEARTSSLALCLLLARIHGKSPVEYIADQARSDFVTGFVRALLPKPPVALDELFERWLKGLGSL
jgi:aminoglycoside phosphotransferase (APT) family kinase protein